MKNLDYVLSSRWNRKNSAAKLLAGLALAAGINTSSTRAEDFYIQPGTYWRDVNEVIANTSPGDRVFLLDGVHEIAFEQNAHYMIPERNGNIYFGGINKNSRNSAVVKLQEDNNSQALIDVLAPNIILRNMTLQGPAAVGVVFRGESAYKSVVEKINAFDLEIVAAWDNYYNEHNTKPSFIFLDMYIQRALIGFHMNERINQENSAKTRYASFTNITVDNVIGLFEVPFYRHNGKLKAKGEFFDNVVINSGSIFPDDIFWFNVEFKTTPDGFVEWNNASESLFSRGVGERNKEADPLLNCYGRPEKNSPVFDERANDRHSGTFSFSGDFNNDVDADLDDFSYFPQTFSGPNISAKFKNIYDSNCDEDMDLKDFAFFQRTFTGEK